MHSYHPLSRVLGIAALAILFGAPAVYAQNDTATTTPGTTSNTQSSSSGASGAASASANKGSDKALSKADQNIMREIAYANLSEIETGKIALKQSKNDQVRNYAQKMIDDHTQAQKELEQLAQQKGVTLPTEPDNKHQTAAKKLSTLEGEKFDQRYMAQGGMTDHRNTHRLLERAQNRASDPDLKALAAKMTPVVAQHLTMAKEVHGEQHGGTSGGSMGPAGTSSTSSGAGSSDSPSGESGTSGSSNSVGPGKQ